MFSKVDCSKPCETESSNPSNEYTKCKSSFFQAQTRISDGKTSFLIGDPGPVELTTDGVQINFGCTGSACFTNKGVVFRW